MRSRVEEMVLAGQIEEVARCCESDVLNTYRVWRVYELSAARSMLRSSTGARVKFEISSQAESRPTLTCVRRLAWLLVRQKLLNSK
jgi:predicted 3'-5' exonuclease similar to PolB exonuclease domain